MNIWKHLRFGIEVFLISLGLFCLINWLFGWPDKEFEDLMLLSIAGAVGGVIGNAYRQLDRDTDK